MNECFKSSGLSRDRMERSAERADFQQNGPLELEPSTV
jgi:hypothetical protein